MDVKALLREFEFQPYKGLGQNFLVDRGVLETLRLEELRLADAASARVLDAVAEAARILTPEQREELLSRLDRHVRSH